MSTQKFKCLTCGRDVVYEPQYVSGGLEFFRPDMPPPREKKGEAYLTCPIGHGGKSPGHLLPPLAKAELVMAPAPDPEVVRPLVDHKYWFARSKELVDKASSVQTDAAAKLQNTLVWLWGVYTASAAVGLALAKSRLSLPATAIIALPSVLLVAAYWLTTHVQMPSVLWFDPQIPDSIQGAVEAGVRIKRRRLLWAMISSFLAATSVAIAIFAAALTGPPVSFRVRGVRCASSGGEILTVVGTVLPSTDVALKLPNKGPRRLCSQPW